MENSIQNHTWTNLTREHTTGRSYSQQPIGTSSQTNIKQHRSLPPHNYYSHQIKRRLTSEEEVDNFLAGMTQDIKQIIVNAHQKHPKNSTRVENPEIRQNMDDHTTEPQLEITAVKQEK